MLTCSLFQSKQDSMESSIESKRNRIELPSTTIKSRSLTSSPDSLSKLFRPVQTVDEQKEALKDEKAEDSEATDIEETDAGEFAVEMGLACSVCKQIDFQSGNQLVECQDCHNLYHQECHKPPVTEQNVSDPRFVWYCAKCTKTIKKITDKSLKTPPSKPATMSASSAFQAAINQGKESAMQLVKAKEKAQESSTSTIQPFKRTELKSPLPTSSNNQSKPIGLAGLANIARTSSATATTQSATSSAASVDKRLQLMKKKAAKANEKKRGQK